MMKIREYQTSDWPVVKSWWKASGEMAPLPDMMPEESSFVAEVDHVPALAVAIYLTNTKELAYVENFVGNPAMSGKKRREAALILSDHIAKFAKGRGFKRLMCMTEKKPLVGRYKELGYKPTLGGVTTLVREL
jgi:hypothetical protein